MLVLELWHRNFLQAKANWGKGEHRVPPVLVRESESHRASAANTTLGQRNGEVGSQHDRVRAFASSAFDLKQRQE
jgi:hypothetical protein